MFMQKHIKDLVTQSANIVFRNGGAIRAINFIGTKTLPQKIKRHKNRSPIGECVSTTVSSASPSFIVSYCMHSYWTMHFDASPQALTQLNRNLRTDTRVLRWTNLKLGEKLDDIVGTREKTTRPTPHAPGARPRPTADLGRTHYV